MTMESKKSSHIEYQVADTIRLRKSGRAYAHREIEKEKINSLFEAARWAPSSMNEQPWAYIYATKDQPELWNKLFDALMEGNQIWAKHAPLLVLSLARKNYKGNDEVNSTAKYDMGGANAFLSLQATGMGLNVHQMGGFKKKDIMESLNIPDSFEPTVILAIGYPGDPDQLPEHLKKREEAPRYRVVQQEFVMNKSF